jgi:hypothetical protein
MPRNALLALGAVLALFPASAFAHSHHYGRDTFQASTVNFQEGQSAYNLNRVRRNVQKAEWNPSRDRGSDQHASEHGNESRHGGDRHRDHQRHSD